MLAVELILDSLRLASAIEATSIVHLLCEMLEAEFEDVVLDIIQIQMLMNENVKELTEAFLVHWIWEFDRDDGTKSQEARKKHLDSVKAAMKQVERFEDLLIESRGQNQGHPVYDLLRERICGI